MKKPDDARVIWARGCEPPRPKEYPPNNEAKRVEWTETKVLTTDTQRRIG